MLLYFFIAMLAMASSARARYMMYLTGYDLLLNQKTPAHHVPYSGNTKTFQS
jgi:hypothetical protein